MAKMNRSGLAIVAAGLLALALGGCSSGNISGAGYAASPATAAATGDDLGMGAGSLRVVDTLPPPVIGPGGSSQVVSPNDVIEVSVFEVPNLSRTAQVDASGQLSLSLIGSVPAAGKTLAELERTIEQRYGAKYLQNPDVTVFMKESMGQRVTLDGEFNKAGIYPTTANMSLLQAVAVAGNFTKIGDPTKVFIYRRHGQEQLVAQYNVEDIRGGKRPNPIIYGGDVVVAFPSGMRVLGSNLREALSTASAASIFF